MEEARGAAVCQQERLRTTLMDVVRKVEEHEKNTGNKSRDEQWGQHYGGHPVESAPDAKRLNWIKTGQCRFLS